MTILIMTMIVIFVINGNGNDHKMMTTMIKW